MSRPEDHPDSVPCRGPQSLDPGDGVRFCRTGLAGFATLSLPGVLRLQASSDAASHRRRRLTKCGHHGLATWRYVAPRFLRSQARFRSEYRGPFGLIATKVPGLQFTELLPRQAAIADKFTVLRSMRQTAGGHPAGSMQLLSGDPDTGDKPKPRFPDWMSVTNYLRSQGGARENPLPAYVGINPPMQYNGPAYLGDTYSPFVVSGDPSSPSFSVPNIGLTDRARSESSRPAFHAATQPGHAAARL